MRPWGGPEGSPPSRQSTRSSGVSPPSATTTRSRSSSTSLRQASGHVIESVRGQVDIMPTVTDLLGIDLSQTPHIGASMFDDRPRVIQFRHYSPGDLRDRPVVFQPGWGYVTRRVAPQRLGPDAPLSTVPEYLYEREGQPEHSRQVVHELPADALLMSPCAGQGPEPPHRWDQRTACFGCHLVGVEQRDPPGSTSSRHPYAG